MSTHRLILLPIFLLAIAPLAAQDGVDLLGDGPPPVQAPAAEPPAPPDDLEAQTALSRRALVEVNGLMREGLGHVRRYNEDQGRNATAIVDAAIAYGRARSLLPADAPPEMTSDIQANLFWCRKQMNLEALKDYIARKGPDFAIASQQMRAVAETPVDPVQAPVYARLAEAYAVANPGDHLQIAIRFTEIAERFPGTQQGTDANRRAAAALQAQMRTMQEAQQAARETRFTRPAQVVPGRTAVPGVQAQKDAQTLIRKSYAKAYAKRDAAAKSRLARRLIDESAKNVSDPAVFHQMLCEAIRLSSEAEAYEPLLDAVDRLASTFTGIDPQTEKQTALKRMSGKAVAAAVLKLLADPRDPAANQTVGKWYCFSARRWDEGFRLLALADDAELARVAGMDQAVPHGTTEQLQLADAWYDLSLRQRPKDDRTGMQARAMHWYLQSVDGLDGLAKERVAKRIAEIDKLLPLDLENVDWDGLTASQWDKLKGRVAAVNARVDRFDPQIALGAGDRFRVVPNPADNWTITIDGWIGEGRKQTCDWRGYDDNVRYLGRGAQNFNLGALLAWVENGERHNAGIVSGPGRLYFAPHIVGWVTGDRTGIIRVKLVPVGDDE
jgi:hypothetical protein